MAERKPQGARRGRAIDDDALASVERSMVAIRRSISRRTLGRLLMKEFGKDDMAALGVVDVVELGGGQEGEGGEVTVGMVGSLLGLDPSRASRVVTAAIEAGYVKRVASQGDGRRITLVLTPQGEALGARAQEVRKRVFKEAMADWSTVERQEFARLLSRFVTDLGSATRES